MVIFDCVHADTCLSDYWCGHHRPHVQIPVWHGVKLKEIKRAILSELREGAVAGNDDDAFLLSADFVGVDRDKDATKVFNAAVASVNRIKPGRKGQRRFFTDLPPIQDDSVYAFFVFVRRED